MADTTFIFVLPALKARDLGDNTYAVALEYKPATVGGTDTTFANVSPPLKAIDLGDGTYAIAIAPQI